MKIIAHRSGPSTYPEQTVRSGLDALRAGADMVEADVRLCADGGVIISHDGNLSRVFGADIGTRDITKAEFTALRRPDGFYGHTPEDYLDAGVLPLLLHIKEDEVLLPTLDILRAHGVQERVTVGAQNARQIRAVKEFDPRLRVLAFMRDVSCIGESIAAGADIIRLWEGWYTPERLAEIRAAGRECWIMTGGCDGNEVGETSPEKLRFLVSQGVDGILINDVRPLIAEINGR